MHTQVLKDTVAGLDTIARRKATATATQEVEGIMLVGVVVLADIQVMALVDLPQQP